MPIKPAASVQEPALRALIPGRREIAGIEERISC
jgi:hypothetical protein